jgi:hypothetical protein
VIELKNINVMNENEPKFVDVNGAQVMDLTPDYERPLAIVDLDVLKRLTKLLPKANLHEIVESHVIDVRNAQSIGEFADVLSEELAFHQTVNLIKEVTVEPVKVVGRIDLED